MGSCFSKCCEVEINFRCTLCNGRSSPEPEVPIELSNAHNEEGGKPFAVNKVLPNLMEALEKSNWIVLYCNVFSILSKL